MLVTGGAGFIGSHLSDRLLEQGHEVVVVDNLTTGRRANVPDGARFVEGDIQVQHWLDWVFKRPIDVVVHAAASYKDPDDWRSDVATNTFGTAEVVKAARGHGCRRFIYFQTALCYGTTPDEQPVSLDHPLRPDSSYAISKTAAEQYIALSGLDWVSFRLANCYGPRNLSGPLPTFFKRLTEGDPVYVADSRRDFVFVDDLVELVMRAVGGTGRGVYHASSGSDYAISDLYGAVTDALGGDLPDAEVKPRSEGDAETILLDPSRTRREFAWWPTTPLGVGVARAVEWYRENGVGETYTHLKIAT